MSRVVFYTATSLNGFIATEENSLDWLFEVGSPDAVDFKSFLAGIDVVGSGSSTYEGVYDFEKLARTPGHNTYSRSFGVIGERFPRCAPHIPASISSECWTWSRITWKARPAGDHAATAARSLTLITESTSRTM